MKNLPPTPNQRVLNPLLKDLIFTYDLSGEAKPETIILPAMEVTSLPHYLAEIAIKKIIDEVINEKGIPKGTNYEDYCLKLREKICV